MAGGGCAAARHCMWWPLCILRLGTVHTLPKFALSPGPRLAGLEWVCPQENSWPACTASRLTNKGLHGPTCSRWSWVYTGGGGCGGQQRKMVPASPPRFLTSPPTRSKISMKRSVLSVCPQCCVNCPCFMFSLRAAVSSRTVSPLTLAFPAHPGSKSHWFYRLTEFRPLVFKAKYYGD